MENGIYVGQEDSVILNKASFERGMFNITHFNHYEAENKKDDSQRFEIPTKEECNPCKCNRIDHLDSEGIAEVGTLVKKGDVLIGITQKVTKDENFKKPKIDVSVVFIEEDYGVVDKVQRGVNSEGYEYVKISVATIRRASLGDKYASCIAQKGTCGMIFAQEDLPFTREGIVPDIIINTLAIPSRMTVGQLIECIAAKKCVTSHPLIREFSMEKIQIKSKYNLYLQQLSKLKTKKLKDDFVKKNKELIEKYNIISNEKAVYPSDHTVAEGTAFVGTEKMNNLEKEISKNPYVQKMARDLRDMGYDRTGEEVMINGSSGEMFQVPMFIGPVYYQRLKHMVADKWHARSRGAMQQLTRSPVEGFSIVLMFCL